ncbi:hypothetical protein BCR44DRAFT_1137564 [Catenaria anguillulae PL171]|uniref:Uncharacterized protein n=1 Tax=Catenaria anguillulae PL171 TaxID=765915 RepID=A0A1Y2HK11_9FUNG|nr:hypothetical protein BCR44DRAFT_1137564 [Catenaria anguillulae PL171]
MTSTFFAAPTRNVVPPCAHHHHPGTPIRFAASPRPAGIFLVAWPAWSATTANVVIMAAAAAATAARLGRSSTTAHAWILPKSTWPARPMGHQGQPAMPLPAYHQQQQMMAHAQRRPTPAPPSSANGPVRPPMAQDNPNNVVRCSQDKLHYYGRDVMYNDMAVLREAATGAQYQARYVGIQGDDTLWIKPEGSRKRIPMLSLTSGEYLIVSDNGMAGAQPSSGVHVPPPTTLPPLSSVANGSAPQAQQQQWLGPSQAPPAASSAVRHGPVVGSA